MDYHKSNPPIDFYLSQLNWFEINLYNQNYFLEKSDCYDYEEKIHTSVYKDDKLYCEIIHYSNYVEEFEVEYEDKTVWYVDGKETNTYLRDNNFSKRFNYHFSDR